MTVNHVFYLPLILALGGLIGYFLARRQFHARQALEEREQRLLEQKKAERAKKRQDASDAVARD